MKVLSAILDGITEYIDSGSKRFEMDQGFPMTRLPALPKVMEHAEDFQVYRASNGARKVSLTLASETFDQVNPKSLDFISKMLRALFGQYPEIVAMLEERLPTNVIAVSFAEFNFEVGKHCQKFTPSDGAEGFLSYQQLSANLQAVFFNKNETSFLAGITYYPVLKGRAKCFVNDKAAVHLAIGSGEPYPLQNRDKSYQKIQYGNYGRFCSIARKRVMIDCKGKYVRHVEYDHFWNSYKQITCEECVVDSVTYKWKAQEEASESAQPDPLIDQEVIRRIQDLEAPITAFHRDTGKIMDAYTGPNTAVLPQWLEANPEYNIHSNCAPIAKLLLGEEFQDRIGKEKTGSAVAELIQRQMFGGSPTPSVISNGSAISASWEGVSTGNKTSEESESGSNSGSESGSGSETGSESGSDSGSECGSDSGSDSGSESGSESGSDSETKEPEESEEESEEDFDKFEDAVTDFDSDGSIVIV